MNVKKLWKRCGILALLLLLPCISYNVYHHSTNIKAEENQSHQSTTPIIVLDAGHGGYDCGSISADGQYEKELTLAITLRLATLLEEQGCTILYTRTSDEVSWPADNKQDLASRVAIGEQGQADLYVSLHLNASAYEDGARGFEIYTKKNDAYTTALAQTIADKLDALSYTTNRGIKTTDTRSLYVIDKNDVPALLLELGFITDTQDLSYIADEAFQERLARAIADGILQQL